MVTLKVGTDTVTPNITQHLLELFGGGRDFDPGNYRIDYDSGAMTWQAGVLEYSVNHPTQAFNCFKAVYSGGVQTPFPSAGGQFPTQAQVEAANAGQGLTIAHSGGVIGMICVDTFYNDNQPASTAPTFRLTQLP